MSVPGWRTFRPPGCWTSIRLSAAGKPFSIPVERTTGQRNSGGSGRRPWQLFINSLLHWRGKAAGRWSRRNPNMGLPGRNGGKRILPAAGGVALPALNSRSGAGYTLAWRKRSLMADNQVFMSLLVACCLLITTLYPSNQNTAVNAMAAQVSQSCGERRERWNVSRTTGTN